MEFERNYICEGYLIFGTKKFLMCLTRVSKLVWMSISYR